MLLSCCNVEVARITPYYTVARITPPYLSKHSQHYEKLLAYARGPQFGAAPWLLEGLSQYARASPMRLPDSSKEPSCVEGHDPTDEISTDVA